jgi:hypothetical protein
MSSLVLSVPEGKEEDGYRRLKMRYFHSLKVAPPVLVGSLPRVVSDEGMITGRSAPLRRFSYEQRSAPIAIPESFRQHDESFCRSPTDLDWEQSDEQPIFDMD